MSKPKKLQIRNSTAEFLVFTTGIGSAEFSRQSRLARLVRPKRAATFETLRFSAIRSRK